MKTRLPKSMTVTLSNFSRFFIYFSHRWKACINLSTTQINFQPQNSSKITKDTASESHVAFVKRKWNVHSHICECISIPSQQQLLIVRRLPADSARSCVCVETTTSSVTSDRCLWRHCRHYRCLTWVIIACHSLAMTHFRSLLNYVTCECLSLSGLFVLPMWGRGTPLFPLSIYFLLLLLSFLHWLYLFSSFVHPFLFYQNSPTPFSGRRSRKRLNLGLVCCV